MRDSASGELGLLMKNGEVMTAEKLKRQMEIAAKCMETLQQTEKHNRKLVEENRILKEGNERLHTETRRLETLLNGFEKTRRYETFTDETYRQTLALNEKMEEEIIELERKIRSMKEDASAAERRSRREAVVATHKKRRLLSDEDEGSDENEGASGTKKKAASGCSIAAHITEDGRIPPGCPCDPENCKEMYEEKVIDSENPVEAFKEHMRKHHQVFIFVDA